MIKISGLIHDEADKSDPYNNFVIISIDLGVNPYSNKEERIAENERRKFVVEKAKEFLLEVSAHNVELSGRAENAI